MTKLDNFTRTLQNTKFAILIFCAQKTFPS